MSIRTDEELMRLVRMGERPALEELYDRYVKLVYAFARKSAADEHAAREIVQAVFIRLWTSKAVYRAESGKFVNWLLTITRNVAVDHVRKERQGEGNIPLDTAAVTLEASAVEDLPEAAVERRMVRERIRRACTRLSERQVQLIEQVYWQGYSLREAAERSGEPIGTIKNRLHQALKVLRLHLSSSEEGWS